MIKKLKFNTLEYSIYFKFSTMFFLAIVIMQLIFFRFTTDTVRSSTLGNNRTQLKQLTAQIDKYITDIKVISKAVVTDNIIQNYLDGADVEPSHVERQLNNYMGTRNDISNILLVDRNSSVVFGDKNVKLNPWVDIKGTKWFSGSLERKGEALVSSSYVQNIIAGRYTWVISVSREIISSKTGQSIGVLLIDLKFNRIDELCRSLVLGKKGYDFIIDNKGNYVFHPTQQLVYSNLKSEPIDKIFEILYNPSSPVYQDGDKFFIVEKLKAADWNIVYITHNDDIITDWKSPLVANVIIGLVLFLVTGFITNRISSGITLPVRKLQNIMNSVEKGEFNLIGPINATDEINDLACDYDIMVGKIKELIKEITREQELKRKSDLKALQAQINPHFLYNTLDSIIWMGEMGETAAVVKMTSALAKLFRISISKGREIITIREELAHAQAYLDIQEMRYQDKFSYTIDFCPDILDLPILKIILQPLIENAIYHGIKESKTKGIIMILGRIENDNIVIEVKDNGKGLSKEKLNEIAIGIQQKELLDQHSYGVGLRNVHQRIQLYFGDLYGLEVKSDERLGATLHISLPLHFEENIL